MEIKSYTKKELALAYSPNLTMVSALNRLATWITGNEDLLSALQRSGYSKNQRIFTSYQVRLIFGFLGEP